MPPTIFVVEGSATENIFFPTHELARHKSLSSIYT
jgi:hypothetical protein